MLVEVTTDRLVFVRTAWDAPREMVDRDDPVNAAAPYRALCGADVTGGVIVSDNAIGAERLCWRCVQKAAVFVLSERPHAALHDEQAAPRVQSDEGRLRQLVEALGQALRDSDALLASHQNLYRGALAVQLKLYATRSSLMVQNGRLVQALITLSLTEGMADWVAEQQARGNDLGELDWVAHVANTALNAALLDHAEEAALLQDIAAAADTWDQAITNLNGIADSEAALRAMVVRWRSERTRKAGS